MDWVLWLQAVLMGLVEGLTEFLPISSTGHLILTGSLLGFLSREKRDVFEIFIQLGAILAVLWFYRAKFIDVTLRAGSSPEARRFLGNLLLAFLPIAIVGLLFNRQIKAVLFHPVPVATAFIVGGLIILWAERRVHAARIVRVDDLRWTDALKIGLVQCLGLLPGTSRSGATIIGSLFFGLSRQTATEFSFFLAIPTLGSASLYSLWKARDLLSWDDAYIFAIGCAAAFVSALLTIKVLLRFVASHSFEVFAWYRIGFGILVLITAYSGWVDWSH
ncbi:undecaprenyl-diphosphate phosphatase [Chitinimonas lacunae]|uniref:Undecaprenyl-diphosphatase n=1 Tax=Chitinimonas lacunae TaxID=1963018 RepID=A0ABV8MTW0_9NEIS